MGKRKVKKKNTRVIVALAFIFIVGILLTSFIYKPSNNQNYPVVAEVNKPAPDFTIYLIDGKKTKLSNFFGKQILLWFVATWCVSCQVGAKILSNYYSLLHSKGVVILTILLYNNMGIQGPSLEEFAMKFAGGFKPDWLYGETDESTMRIYNPNNFLDIFYFISKNGIIVYKGVVMSEDKLNYILSLVD